MFWRPAAAWERLDRPEMYLFFLLVCLLHGPSGSMSDNKARAILHMAGLLCPVTAHNPAAHYRHRQVDLRIESSQLFNLSKRNDQVLRYSDRNRLSGPYQRVGCAMCSGLSSPLLAPPAAAMYFVDPDHGLLQRFLGIDARRGWLLFTFVKFRRRSRCAITVDELG
jgi:hypothetical protein